MGAEKVQKTWCSQLHLVVNSVLKTNRQTVVGLVSSHCLRKKEKHSTKWPASNKLLGQHFAKNCKQATAYTSHINYAKLLIQ